jgi:predicted permease
MLIASLFRRLWFWMRRHKLDAGFDEEVRLHFELKVQEKIAEGISPQEAWRLARLEFGNPALAREHTRQSLGFPLLESLAQDIHYGARQLRKNPGFTAIAVLTLALGIGANSAMFSFVNAFLLSSLPFKDPQELVQVSSRPRGGFEQQTYEYLRDHNHTLAGLIAWDDGNIGMTVDGNATIVPVDYLSANAFSLLGVPAYRGRVFSPEDDLPGKPAVAVISYAYWEQRFGLDSSVIGKTVQFKDVSCTIIGIAPPWFHGLRTGGAALPITLPAQWHQHLTLKDNTTFDLYARLAKGVDMKQAEADLDLLYHQELESRAGQIDDAVRRKNLLETRITVVPAREGTQAFDSQFALQLRLLEAVVGLVLLVACVNLANLLLARGTARRREIGIRLALGARRGRIVRQLLTENLLLSLLGGGVGLALSTQLTHVLLFVLQGRSDTAALGIHVDATVFLFTAVLSLLTGLIFGLLPALRSSRTALAISIRGGELSPAGKPVRSTRLLMAPQIAISLVVLILSGLLLRSLQRLHEVDLGFKHDHLLTFWLMPTLSGYEGEKELRLYDDVLAVLNQLPGVRAVSLSRWSLLRRGRIRGLTVEGVSYPDASLVRAVIAPRFFDTLHLPVLAGRDFQPQDSASSLPVAIINEATARKYFAAENPIGRRITVPNWEPGVTRTIVGVAGNMKFSFRQDMPTEAVYIPYAQAPEKNRGQAMIKISTAVDPESLMPMIRQRVRAIAKDLPPIQGATEDEVLDEANGPERSLSSLLAGFGVLALVMSLVGLYGTVSYSVSRRIREIAIRMALGAQHGELLWMIVSQSLRVVLVGAAIGAISAVAASRMLESFLFGVRGFDPLTYFTLITALVAAAAIAAYLPARRAVHVDPVIALRDQ